MDIRDKICEIVAMVFRVEPQNVKTRSDDEPLGVLGLDSLNCMDIVVNLEEEFGIVFEDEELLLDSLNTVKKLRLIVETKQALLSTGGG
ncbi:acyl carrier protein [Gorillibacterium timonense]|uniref:acyl carrier protein n=1 Tax=Gorillibacterium timonense TaxID=1689269 RepID=UPI00131B232F|nr:acyl carrier protein [Gorillibacterium timonense]